MPSNTGSGGKIKTAVITGAHPYDVVGLQTLFRSLPEVDAYLQHLEDFVTDTGGSRESYEAVVFYNAHIPTPGDEQYQFGGSSRDVLSGLGETDQGIFLLHHSILAYAEWELWQDICGGIQMTDGPVLQDQTVRIHNIVPDHPVTRGVADFEIVDETYAATDAGDGSEVLLTTDHPESMRTMGWTRHYKNARVFCYQSGHDAAAFTNHGFRTIVTRGIQWCARRI